MAVEHAALRRVAQLMARGGRGDDLSDAVLREAARVVGTVVTLTRVDAAEGASMVTRGGVVGVPVIVGDRLWGVLSASTGEDRLPAAEEDLREFAEILAAAVANAEARARLEELAAEQAALLRVAGLVAAAAAPQVVFDAVAAEASALLDDLPVTLVRFDNDHELVVLAARGGPVAVGTVIVFHPDTHPDRVRRRGAVDRVDDYTHEIDVSLAAQYGLVATVSAPIPMAGRVWGTLTATSQEAPLPAVTEERLEKFARLISAVLTNVQSQDRLSELAEEQAALRRVAELAAQDAPVEQVLQAVAVEASGLADVEFGMVLRYVDHDGGNRIMALHGAPDTFTVGMRAPGTGDGSVHRVWRTGRAARVEDLGQVSGLWPRLSYERGFTTSAGVPVTIRGALWGALIVAGRGQPFPRTIEQHLASFADLAATAIAATGARQELRMAAEEQAALRRVAELVARGASLDEVFSAAAREASTLLGSSGAALVRFEDADAAVVVAAVGSAEPHGSRVPVQPGSALEDLRRRRGPVPLGGTTPLPSADPAGARGSAGAVVVPVTVEGQMWGALTTSPPSLLLPVEGETRLAPFAELVAAAIANAQNRAKLTASRARVVATADETRRRLQRDVHDGAQQRLVHTIIALKLALQAVRAGEPPADLLDEALVNAERANRELRDIAHGILPASLTRGGLGVALDWLVDNLPVEVDLRVTVPRLPAAVETTAYFIVAEAITNVVKHSRATRASVDVDVEDGTLVLEVRDDGVGGADPSGGTGLTGLFDRVEASAGTMTVVSERQAGTTVRATLPLPQPA